MNAKTKQDRGTCGACFREFVLLDGRVVRHGWSEGGGRRVGEYGRAWHQGACFGVSRMPYETSDECTKDFVAKVLMPMIERYTGEIEALEKRPVLYITKNVGHSRVRLHRHTITDPFRGSIYAEGDVEIRRRSGDVEFYLQAGGFPHVNSYEDELSMRLEEKRGKLNAVVSDKDYCEKMIAQWSPQPTKTKAIVRGGVQHAARNEFSTVCGWRRRNHFGKRIAACTEDAEAVTCEKCKAKLAERVTP